MNTVVEETKNEVVEFDPFAAKLAEFKERYDDVVYDLTVPEQEKQARSDKHSIGKIISALDKAHSLKKAPLKIETDKLDSSRKRIKDALLEVQGKIKGQIEAQEKKKEDHAKVLQDLIDYIYALGEFQPNEAINEATISAKLEEAKGMKVDDSFEDRKADGTLAQVETIKNLEEKLAGFLKHVAEQKELAELRVKDAAREQFDRDEKIRKEAEESAKKKAEELAAAAKKENEERAENEKKAAAQEVEDAKKKQSEAEEATKQAEKTAAEATAKAEKEADEKIAQEKKEREEKELQELKEAAAKDMIMKGLVKPETPEEEQMLAHRNAVKSNACHDFVNNCDMMSMDDAEEVVAAIDRGLIEGISINY